MAKIYTKNTWIDEVLSGIAKYLVKNDAGAVVYNTSEISLATGVLTAGSPVNASRLNNIETGIDGLDTLLDQILTGWVAIAETVTYVAANQIKIAGTNDTAKYKSGTKIKFTQTTVKYFYVVSAAVNGADIDVTLTAGTSYTVANAAITLPYFSYMDRAPGFPNAFNFAPTWTASTTNPSLGNGSLAGRFAIRGGMVLVQIELVMGSTTTFGTGAWLFALPIVQASPISSVGIVAGFDASPYQMYTTLANINSGQSVVYPTPWDVTTPITWAVNDALRLQVEYEM